MNKFDYIREVEKYNPNHDNLGRFSSGSGGGATPTMAGATTTATATKPGAGAGASNREYGSTSTKDALAEVNSGKHNSLEKYMDKDGKLTPEREALHKEIIDKLLAGKEPVEGQATMTMLGGGPASGKSSVMSTDTSKDKHAVTVDPDAFKEMLPGYKEMAAKSDQAAAYYHEESSALAKRFSEVAYKENYNVVYDGTADGSDASVLKKINAAKANGYRVEAKYVSVDTDEAVRRNQARYNDAKAAGKNPRLVPDEVVRNTHQNCTDISVRTANQFDHIEVWDNNGGRGQQKMIAYGGNGKGLKAIPGEERAFDNYLNKGSGGSRSFRTAADGTVSRD